jgi:hypothetical protein
MFMICAMALVLRTDKAVEQGGSILQKVSKPAPKPAAPAPSTPAKPQSATPQTPAPNTSPATQPPASQPPAQPKKP